MYDTLVQASELKQLIDFDANVCVFDCRFSLADTNAGRKLWEASHISGAYYAHLDDNLSSKIIPDVTGRHPLPDKQVFVDWLRRHGVNNDTQIVAYDSADGATAARLWWLCRWIGHRHCAVLDGGLGAWLEVGDTDAHYPDMLGNGSLVAQTALVKSLNTLAVVEHKAILLIDAREHPRYRGEHEPIDPIAGHIPGAVSYPYKENLNEHGKFKTTKELQSRFKSLNSQAKEKELVVYCGSGVTAIHNILAMAIAGFDSATLYEDSWSGWILDSRRGVSIATAAD